MINVWIDDLMPCLKDNEISDFEATEVVRIIKCDMQQSQTCWRWWSFL